MAKFIKDKNNIEKIVKFKPGLRIALFRMAGWRPTALIKSSDFFPQSEIATEDASGELGHDFSPANFVKFSPAAPTTFEYKIGLKAFVPQKEIFRVFSQTTKLPTKFWHDRLSAKPERTQSLLVVTSEANLISIGVSLSSAFINS